jgi:hypothetical protein
MYYGWYEGCASSIAVLLLDQPAPQMPLISLQHGCLPFGFYFVVYQL